MLCVPTTDPNSKAQNEFLLYIDGNSTPAGIFNTKEAAVIAVRSLIDLGLTNQAKVMFGGEIVQSYRAN